MAHQDAILVVALVVLVGAIGYLFGTRNPRPVAPAQAPAPTPTPTADEPVGGAAEDAPSPPPVPHISEVPADAALPPLLSSLPPVPLATPASLPPAMEAEVPVVAVTAPAPAEEPAPRVRSDPPAGTDKLLKIDYEEDEELDPTRVGGVQADKRIIYQPPVQKILVDEEADSEEPNSDKPFFIVSANAQTDPGLRRKRNEDSLLVMEEANLYVVADGMGGHRGGQLASQLAVRKMGDAHRTKTFEGDPHAEIPREASELARAIQMANAAIREEVRKQPSLEGMGTTLCTARFSPKKRRMYIGHVGDSRCYRLRDGMLTQLTADHTMADYGVKGPESQHLSRAIGLWSTVPIDVLFAVPQVGDRYLICSDGLNKMLDDEQIAQVLRNEEDPKSAVERLVFFSNAKGGKDNITIVLLRVVEPAKA